MALEAGAEAEEEKDKDMESTHTLLLAQLEAACAQGEVAGDLGFVTWMKAPATLDLVASWLAEMHISPTHARVLLGLLYMVRLG